MFRNLFCCIVLAVACVGCSCPRSEKCCPLAKAGCKNDGKVLRHVILFKFKEGTTAEQIEEVEKAFASLPDKISEIECFEGGANVSPDKRNEGYTHCFVLTFQGEADRDAYLANPEFKEFGKLLWDYLEKVLVFDYWTMH